MIEIDQVYQGDCLERMQEIDSNSIDLTVTSPPYDNLRSYKGNNEQWGEHVWKAVIEKLFRVTKQGGIVVWIVGDATINGSETGTSFKQALYAMDCGFNLHDTMIWDKGNFTAVGSLKTRYAPTFDYMFIWTKGKPKVFNPIKDRKNKHAGTLQKGTVVQADGTKKRVTSHNRRTFKKFGQRHNIWSIVPCKKRINHSARFPEQLAHDHIISWSNEGEIVLDPFIGSGTTAVAAKKLNRKFIGIEIEKEYVEICNQRLHSRTI